MYSLSLWIAKVMSGLEMVKYTTLPINLLYIERSPIGLSSLRLSLKLGSLSNEVGLLTKINIIKKIWTIFSLTQGNKMTNEKLESWVNRE